MSLPQCVSALTWFFHAEGATALPLPNDLWAANHWTWEPSITLPLALLALWYLAGSMRRRHLLMLRWRHVAFWSGWLSLSAALVSPLHQLGDALFSAHMLQHEILILIAAPLIAASHPSVTLLYALPRTARRPVGGFVSHIERHPILVFCTGPLAAWVLHAVALWG